MEVSLLAVVILFGVLGIGIFLYESYKHPSCDECGNNLNTKRVKWEKVCSVHG